MNRIPGSTTEFEGDGAPVPAHEPSHIHVVRPSRRRQPGEPTGRPLKDCSAHPDERAALSDR